MNDAALRETIDYVAIMRLQKAYADVVTRRCWPELEPLFLPDAVVRVDTVTADPIELVGPQALGGFISSSIERFEFFEFVILNSHIELDAEQASARVFMCELRQDRQTGHATQVFGLYRDRYVRLDDGRWRFARRDYSSLARTGRNQVFDLPGQL